jgi:hypothetical protein
MAVAYNRVMTTKQLSSDILEHQFGPTSLKILHQDDKIRVIQTIVTKTNQILELSLVRFIPDGVTAFPDIHRQIVAGQSMGKAFRDNDITFQRIEQCACRTSAPLAFAKIFGTKDMTVVSVQAIVGPAKTPFAQITETYSSVVQWPHYFGTITDEGRLDVSELAERCS